MLASGALNVQPDHCDAEVGFLELLLTRVELQSLGDELGALQALHSEGRHEANSWKLVIFNLRAATLHDLRRVEVGGVVLRKNLSFSHRELVGAKEVEGKRERGRKKLARSADTLPCNRLDGPFSPGRDAR